MIARDKAELHLSLPSLLAECAVGYHVGDAVYDHLDDVQLATHFYLIRFFVRHAPVRFTLMLTNRSLDEVFAVIAHLLETNLGERLSALADAAGALWMMESRPPHGGFGFKGEP